MPCETFLVEIDKLSKKNNKSKMEQNTNGSLIPMDDVTSGVNSKNIDENLETRTVLAGDVKAGGPSVNKCQADPMHSGKILSSLPHTTIPPSQNSTPTEVSANHTFHQSQQN